MEGPGRLREKASTPVPMHVRSVTTLRHPQTSERMWTRCEKVSVWGLPVHQGRSTTRRDGSTDPLPPVKRGSPMVTTVESRKGAMALSPPKGAHPLRRLGESRPRRCAPRGGRCNGSDCPSGGHAVVCPGIFYKWSRGLGVTGTVIDRCLGVGVGPLGSACSGWCVGEDWGGGPTHSALETLRLGSGRAECPTPGNGRGGNGEWGGGACRLPGGPIPPGVDGAYEGLCDSWDSFGPFLIRPDVRCRGLRAI